MKNNTRIFNLRFIFIGIITISSFLLISCNTQKKSPDIEDLYNKNILSNIYNYITETYNKLSDDNVVIYEKDLSLLDQFENEYRLVRILTRINSTEESNSNSINLGNYEGIYVLSNHPMSKLKISIKEWIKYKNLSYKIADYKWKIPGDIFWNKSSSLAIKKEVDLKDGRKLFIILVFKLNI